MATWPVLKVTVAPATAAPEFRATRPEMMMTGVALKFWAVMFAARAV